MTHWNPADRAQGFLGLALLGVLGWAADRLGHARTAHQGDRADSMA
jgi:hypothetical protein